jgi:signal transduction histidine kinase
MQNVLNKRIIVSNIIRAPLLRNIFLACLAIVLAFQVYSQYFVYPSFIGLLIKSTEEDAKLTAAHLSRMIVPEGYGLTKANLSIELTNEIEKLVSDFQLESLKIFLHSGEVIYSTNFADIGSFNKKPYFHDFVAKGNTYTNVVQKDTTTLEGRLVPSDVVETYIPILRNGKFVGAFEIYYNITEKKGNLDTLLFHASSIMIIIAISLLVGVSIILYQASKTIIERSMAEDALQQAHLELEQRVKERTAELAEANRKLLQEIAERKLVEKDLRDSEEKLHILSSHLLTAQERERRRISLELHDELGQSLTVLKLQVRSIQKDLPLKQQILRENCENSLQYVDQIIENVRRLSRDLSPSILEDLGLTAALNWLIEDFAKHSGIKVSHDLPGIDNLYTRDAQIIIYRIFQEVFTNVAKHAHASEVAAVIEKKERSINFRVEDNGKGFDIQQIESRHPTAKGLGLVAMDERARMLGGTLNIESQKNKGTVISFSIPIDKGRIIK